MRLTTAPRAIALALCATLLAGCGGGGDAAPVRENAPNRPAVEVAPAQEPVPGRVHLPAPPPPGSST